MELFEKFDENADEVLDIIGIHYRTQFVRIIVSIRRYKGGDPRIAVERQYCSRKHPEWKFRRFGRFMLDEAKEVGRMLMEAGDWKPKLQEAGKDEMPW